MTDSNDLCLKDTEGVNRPTQGGSFLSCSHTADCGASRASQQFCSAFYNFCLDIYSPPPATPTEAPTAVGALLTHRHAAPAVSRYVVAANFGFGGNLPCVMHQALDTMQ